MNTRICMVGLVGAIALSILGATAHAAPAGNAMHGARAAGVPLLAVEKIAYRRCVRRRGYRYCHWRSTYSSYYREITRSVPRLMLGIAF